MQSNIILVNGFCFTSTAIATATVTGSLGSKISPSRERHDCENARGLFLDRYK
jgi:hypothetical protein